jgi:hypothetical protein
MSQPLLDSPFFLLAGAGLIFLVLVGIVAWTTRIGFRSCKLQPPKLWLLLGIAFFQVLLGGLTIFAARVIHNDPWIDIGAGLGMVVLSGLPFIKLSFKSDWMHSLRIWGIAALLQWVLLPICSGILAVGWGMVYFLLYPPQL